VGDSWEENAESVGHRAPYIPEGTKVLCYSKLRVPLEGLVAPKVSTNHGGDHNVPKGQACRMINDHIFCIPVLPLFYM
jgi:hypothetical protein